MTSVDFAFTETPLAKAAETSDVLVAFFGPAATAKNSAKAGSKADTAAPTLLGDAIELDKLSDGQLSRALADSDGEPGQAVVIPGPHGLKARKLVLVSIGEGVNDGTAARKLGVAAARALAGAKATKAQVRFAGVAGKELGDAAGGAEFALGLALASYRFTLHKSKVEGAGIDKVEIAGAGGKAGAAAFKPLSGLATGVYTARDLVNEPANVLTPENFAKRIKDFEADGLKVEILREKDLEKIGMGSLVAVGRGSRKESYVAIMRWSPKGKASKTPFCLVGKGVCFDTGGISLKPAAGMEEMTMDMGGAATAVGAIRALALRKAPVDVVGIVGLVENMPDGDAQRPGDIVTSLSGQTIEVINTDAEGRLVLCDLLTYVQDRFTPSAIIDLATLTGAIIIALGHDKAGIFSNDDALAGNLLAAAEAEGEGAWRLPLAKSYDKQLRSRLADMKNVGGRPAGSITAAQFLQRFVKPGQPWAHIDIAGVALTKEDGPFWPKGASGWGVTTLVRLAENAD